MRAVLLALLLLLLLDRLRRLFNRRRRDCSLLHRLGGFRRFLWFSFLYISRSWHKSSIPRDAVRRAAGQAVIQLRASVPIASYPILYFPFLSNHFFFTLFSFLFFILGQVLHFFLLPNVNPALRSGHPDFALDVDYLHPFYVHFQLLGNYSLHCSFGRRRFLTVLYARVHLLAFHVRVRFLAYDVNFHNAPLPFHHYTRTAYFPGAVMPSFFAISDSGLNITIVPWKLLVSSVEPQATHFAPSIMRLQFLHALRAISLHPFHS